MYPTVSLAVLINICATVQHLLVQKSITHQDAGATCALQFLNFNFSN